jgi:hypothetical protein
MLTFKSWSHSDLSKLSDEEIISEMVRSTFNSRLQRPVEINRNTERLAETS